MEFHILDVFTDTQLTGNQLAVVLNASGLSSDKMQDIAREMNFSETTFVTRRSDTEADVRIFTPTAELPFAGHPTLGTAWLLSEAQGTYTLNLGIGKVAVEFRDGIGWIAVPPVELGEEYPAAAAAALIGLETTDLHLDFPAQRAVVGPRFVLIGVNSLAALKRCKLDADLHAKMPGHDKGVQAVFVFSDEPYEDSADFASRMFFDAMGIREDPATGSANCAFAAYLKNLRGSIGEVVVDQGVEIRRPSRLYLSIGEQLAVGGHVVASSRGELLI